MVISCLCYSPSLSLVIFLVPIFSFSVSHFLSYISISSLSFLDFFINFQFHLRTKPFFIPSFWTTPPFFYLYWFWFSSMLPNLLSGPFSFGTAIIVTSTINHQTDDHNNILPPLTTQQLTVSLSLSLSVQSSIARRCMLPFGVLSRASFRWLKWLD